MNKPERVQVKALRGQFASPPVMSAADGFASNTVSGAPNIAELARALKNDIDLIFEFVYENIEYIPAHGSQKGAVGCLIDGKGNAFDQAELLVELLREAGYTASYQLGDLQILEADAAAIFGTDVNIWAISNLLAAGGIPNSTHWDWPNWYIRFTHCWVKVDIGGTDYHFDPALKQYTTVSGMDLETALDYDATDFMNDAESGATLNANYVQNINRSNIRANLETMTENLIDYINTNDPDATTDKVLGGRTINELTSTIRDTAHPDLQPSTSPTTWSTNIPDAYKAVLTVEYDTISESFYSRDISHKRLTLTFNGSLEAELRLDGVLIDTSSAQGTGTWNSVWLEVEHPYGSTFADEGHWQTVWADKPYLICQGWGNAGRGMIEWHRKKYDQNVFDGGTAGDEDVIGETMAQLFATWNAQK
ncbi:MAG TPA: transglutaminase domain-containing protein, partial [Gemmatales bacterium]|nr:transglutaminase domain-containing protein [Gemmatales bacterium]